MAPKAFLVICASALFIQSISAQCAGAGSNIGNIEVNNIGLANGIGNGVASIGPGLGAAGLSLANLGGNGYAANGFVANGLANGLANMPRSGGAFTVTSYSPIAPIGLSVVSENAIDGTLAVSGALPFLSAIGLEGQVPANGAAGVQYGCGNGNVGIVSENVAPAAANGYNGMAGPGLAGPGLAGLGYGGPLANAGKVGPALNGPISRPYGPNNNIY